MNTTGIYKCLECGKLYEIPLVAVPDISDKCPYCGGAGWRIGEFKPNGDYTSGASLRFCNK